MCLSASQSPLWNESETKKWHEKLVAAGIAPAWALGTWAHTVQSLPADFTIRKETLKKITADFTVTRYTHRNVPFVYFTAGQQGCFDLIDLYHSGEGSHLACDWQSRLLTALWLPLSAYPFPAKDKEGYDFELWNRSPLDLMHHLAHDGNRLVRWAAQTRLADPDFVFTWHEDDE